MEKIVKSKIVTTGLAMFAMFFGAGNVVFPLALGQQAQDNAFFAILGLVLSAICVPFTGLVAMILFNGDYTAFFGRIGKVPGFILSTFILCLIGPFGATPRCIALAYSTISMFNDTLSLPVFSVISCLLILLFTLRPTTIIDTLGAILTPFLLLSLGVIIVLGIALSPEAPVSEISRTLAFTQGLTEGYNTMDLLGAFFFSTVVIVCLEQNLHAHEKQEQRKVMALAVKASFIGAFLLAAIYVGFCYVAAFNSTALEGVTPDMILGTIAFHILGPYAGIVTSIAVALACLTTAIALTTVFSEFLHHDIFKDKVSYKFSLSLTLIATFFVSTLNFTGIIQLLGPVLQVCYPALIALSILNLLHKLYNFQAVKIPFFLVFFATLLQYFL